MIRWVNIKTARPNDLKGPRCRNPVNISQSDRANCEEDVFCKETLKLSKDEQMSDATLGR